MKLRSLKLNPYVQKRLVYLNSYQKGSINMMQFQKKDDEKLITLSTNNEILQKKQFM